MIKADFGLLLYYTVNWISEMKEKSSRVKNRT